MVGGRYYKGQANKVVDKISTILHEFDLIHMMHDAHYLYHKLLWFGLVLDINASAPEIALVPRAKIVVTDKTKICLFKMPINQIL